MSSEDQLRPYHAKDEGRGQDAAEALAAVMKHAAEREEAIRKKPARKRQPRWMLPLGIQLSVLALYLLVAPPRWATINPIEPRDPALQVEDLRLAMYMQIQRVEAYRVQHGRLPDVLAEAGSAVPGVEYRRQGANRYQLLATAGEEAVVYDSTEPADEFVGSAVNKLNGG
jgi:hypothetical protein